MRGTLHFVAAADVRWMTQLLAPRVLARHAARWKRDFGVDAALVARADEILTRFDVPHECRVVSAHRTPAWMAEYASRWAAVWR